MKAKSVDTTPPSPPIIEPVIEGDNVIFGTTEPNAVVTVMMPSGAEVSTWAAGDGFVSIAVYPNEIILGNKLFIFATDLAGNESAKTLVVISPFPDIEPPEPPIINPVFEGDSVITGTAEPESEVTILLRGSDKVIGITDSDGQFSVAVDSSQFDEWLEMTAYATDKAGNSSEIVLVTSNKKPDLVAPDAPVLLSVTEGDNVINGQSEPLAEIKILLADGTTILSSANNDGKFWELVNPNLLIAGQSISAFATDEAGNVSEKTTTTILKKASVVEPETPITDTTAPEPPILLDITEGANIIKGLAEIDSKITIEMPDGTKLLGEANNNGDFNIVVDPKLVKAGATITAYATDAAGNVSGAAVIEVIKKVVVVDPETPVEDVTPPDAPVLQTVTVGDRFINGKAEAGSEVTVHLYGRDKVSGIADSDGKFSIAIKRSQIDEWLTLYVYATDKAGNRSDRAEVRVNKNMDREAPSAPTIKTIIEGDRYVHGLTEPFADVTIQLPNGSTETFLANEDGNFSVAVDPKLIKMGHSIIIYVTDAAGNISEKISTKIVAKETIVDPGTPKTLENQKPDTTATKPPINKSADKAEPKLPSEKSADKTLPKTGENLDVSMIAGFAAALSGLGFWFAAKKNKEEKS